MNPPLGKDYISGLIVANINAVKTLAIIMMLLGSSVGMTAPVPCSVQLSQDEKSLHIQMGAKSISIYGWTHTSESEMLSINYAATRLAANKYCAFNGQLLGSALNHKDRLIAEAARIHSLISQSPFKNSAVYASEISEEELDAYEQSKFKLRSANLTAVMREWDLISKKCPYLRDAVNTFKVIAIKPLELVWATQKTDGFSPTYIGVDHKLYRKAYFNLTTKESRAFDPEIENLPAAAAVLISQIQKDVIKFLKPPTEYQIEEAVSLIIDENQKIRVRDGLKTSQLVAQLSLLRDLSIAEKIIGANQNVIVAIGIAHINDLKNIFESKCQQQ